MTMQSAPGLPPDASNQITETKGTQDRVRSALDTCSPLQLRYLGFRHQGYNDAQACNLVGITIDVSASWRAEDAFRVGIAAVLSGEHRGALGKDLAKRIAIARAPHHALNLDSLATLAHRDSDKIAASDKVLQLADAYPRSQGAQLAIQVNVSPATIAPQAPAEDTGY